MTCIFAKKQNDITKLPTEMGGIKIATLYSVFLIYVVDGFTDSELDAKTNKIQ